MISLEDVRTLKGPPRLVTNECPKIIRTLKLAVFEKPVLRAQL